MSLENTMSKTLAEKNAEEMATYFGKDEYGVKHYNKDDKEIGGAPKTLTEKNADGIAKYFDKGEYGVKNYDKDDKEIVAEIEAETGEKLDAKELALLKSKVVEARNKYATVDYKEDKKLGMLRRILGLKGKNLNTDTRRNAHNDYKIQLTALSDYEVNKLREGGMKNEEELMAKVEGLVKYFDTDEKTNLYEARTNARTEAWEGKTGGKVMEKAGDFVNWYRKQNVWAKGAVGSALAVSGVAVGAFGLGAAAAAAVGVGATGMKFMGGAAAGVGVATSLEAKHRMQEKNKTESQRKNFLTQLEGAAAESKLTTLMGKLDAEIGSYEGSLQNEKKQALKRKMIGAGVGIFIGSGAMGKLLGGGLHMIAETDAFKGAAQFVASSEIVKTTTSFWKGKLENIFVSSRVDHAATLDSFPSKGNIPASGAMEVPTAESTAIHSYTMDSDTDPVIKAVGNQDVESGKVFDMDINDATGRLNMKLDGVTEMAEGNVPGSTFDDPVWKNATYANQAGEGGSILDMNMDDKTGHLNISPDDMAGIGKVDLEVTKGSSLEGTLIKHFKDAGMDAQAAGTKAHQMALAYAKEYNLSGGPQSLIHPGTHIEVNAEGKILNISGDDKLGYLHPKSDVPHAASAEVAPDPVSAAPENPMDNPARTAPATPETPVETPPETPVKSVGHDYYSEPDLVTSSEGVSTDTGAPKAAPGIGHDYDSEPSSTVAPETVSASTEAPQAPESNDVTPHEAVAPIEINYGYENFSQDLDKMVMEVQNAREAITKEYGLGDDLAIDSRMNSLEDKIKYENIGGIGDTLKHSPLVIAEQRELDTLRDFKQSFGVAYGKLVDTFLDIKKDGDLAILDENAGQYLADNKQSKVAKIFTHLKQVTTAEEMNTYKLNPGQSEKMADWYKRVIKFMLKKKMEGVK